MHHPYYSDYDEIDTHPPFPAWCECHQMPWNGNGCPDCLDEVRTAFEQKEQGRLQILHRIGRLTRQERRERRRARHRTYLHDVVLPILVASAVVAVFWLAVGALIWRAWVHHR